MRGLDALAGSAGIIELRDPAGITAGKPQRIENSSLCLAEQKPSGSRGGCEYIACAGALKAAPEMGWLDCKPDADCSLVARNHGSDDLRSRRADLLRGCKCRRPHRNAGMQHGSDMGIVAIEARAEGDVHEGSVLQIEHVRGVQDMGRARLADRADIAAGPAAPRQARADGADAKKIEQQPAELLAHLIWQRGCIKPGSE